MTSSVSSTANMMRRMPSVFAGASFGSAVMAFAPVEHRHPYSAVAVRVRSMAMSCRTSSSPMTRSARRPSSGPLGPRACGVDPSRTTARAPRSLWSPRQEPACSNSPVVPAHARLVPMSQDSSSVRSAAPRTRGVGPGMGLCVMRTRAGWSLKIWSRPAMHRFDRAHDGARRASRTTAGTEVRHHA